MAGLDPVIHAPARLRIMTTLDETLADGDSVNFPRLRELLDMTAGNLTTHLSKLENAGYVAIEKAFEGRKPVTRISLTLAGRAAFREYRTTLLDLIGRG
ncbi:MAG: transcriptional regulator [Pseudoclavibacter sp.]